MTRHDALKYLILILLTTVSVLLSEDINGKNTNEITFKLTEQYSLIDQILTTRLHKNQSTLLFKNDKPRRQRDDEDSIENNMNITKADKRLFKNLNKIKIQKALQEVNFFFHFCLIHFLI